MESSHAGLPRKKLICRNEFSGVLNPMKKIKAIVELSPITKYNVFYSL